MSIKTKILFVILFVLIIFAGMIVYIISTSRQSLLNQIKENTMIMSESYADEINNKLIYYEKTTQNIASQIKTAISIEEVLMEQKKLYPEFKNLFYTDIDSGKILAMEPYNIEYLNYNFKDKEYWNKVKSTTEKYSVISRDFNGASLIISSPIKIDFSYNEATLQGIITVVIPLSEFFSKINNIVIGKTGNIFVINKKGEFLTHNKENYILNKNLTDLSNDKILKELKAVMTSGNTGNASFIMFGNEYFISFAPIQYKGWSLAINGPLKEHTTEIDFTIITMIIIFTIFLLITLVFVFVIVHYIVKPIRNLSVTISEIEKGNLDRRAKIMTKDEIGKLGKSFNIMASQLQESFNKIKEYNENLENMVKERTEELNITNTKLIAKNEIMMKELEMAKRVQEKLLPKSKDLSIIDELDFGSSYSAVDRIGGDLYDVMRIGRSTFGFYIADVSGHGVPAALITSMAKVSFTTYSNWNINTSETCSKINNEMYNLIGDLEHYLSAYYCKLDLLTGKFQFTNCGHHPAILVKKRDDQIKKLDTDGFFVGAFEDVYYETKEITIEEGDKILLFTDGIIEARNKNGEFYEYTRLMNYIKENMHKSASEFVEGLINEIEVFCKNKPPDDDRAVLYIEFLNKVDEFDSDKVEDSIIVKSKKINKNREQYFNNKKILSEYDKALIHIKQKNYYKAIEILNELRKKDKDNIKILNSIGLTYYKVGQYKKAYEILCSIEEKGFTSKTLRKNISIIKKKIEMNNR